MNMKQLFNLQFLMFAEMAAGFLLCRFGVLKPKDRSVFSKAVISLFLPANIIASFRMEMTPEVLRSFLQIMIVSSAIHVFSMILAAMMYKRNRKAEEMYCALRPYVPMPDFSATP